MAVAARREVVRQLRGLGLSERQALRLVGMSASTLRYEPRDDGNEKLRERLKELAGQHRRHGYRMLHSRLRLDGWAINVKRTYRVYREEGLMVRMRRRKRLAVPERQPLVRPSQPNEVWSMDRSATKPGGSAGFDDSQAARGASPLSLARAVRRLSQGRLGDGSFRGFGKDSNEARRHPRRVDRRVAAVRARRARPVQVPVMPSYGAARR